MSNSDPSGFASGLLLGLVVGAAGGYFLATDKGKELLAGLAAEAGEKLEELENSETVTSILNQIEDLAPREAELLESAKARVNAVASRVVEATSKSKPTPKKRLFFSGGSPLKK